MATSEELERQALEAELAELRAEFPDEFPPAAPPPAERLQPEAEGPAELTRGAGGAGEREPDLAAIAATKLEVAPSERAVKIVATMGPAWESAEMIAQMIRAGVDIVRLNCSHRFEGAGRRPPQLRPAPDVANSRRVQGGGGGVSAWMYVGPDSIDHIRRHRAAVRWARQPAAARACRA